MRSAKLAKNAEKGSILNRREVNDTTAQVTVKTCSSALLES